MHRRSLVASLAALAVSPVAAQTPDPTSPAYVAMETLLLQIIGEGRVSLIPDVFETSGREDEITRSIADLTNDLYAPTPVVPVMIAAADRQAIAFADVGEDAERYLFVHFDLSSRGKVGDITWSWHPR